MRIGLLLLLVGLAGGAQADGDHTLEAHYLANAGVMVSQGHSKVLFDPFFRNDYGVYDLVPEKTEKAIFAGEAPWDGVDAIFISHQHDDHFDPALLVAYLARWPEVEMYAPQQAVDRLLATQTDISEAVLNRINGLDLARDSDPAEIIAGDIRIEGVRVAHAGWPSRHTDVHNIAFRVTLGEDGTVLHLGDADKGREHYEPHRDYWEAREVRVAFAPIWLFLTEPGQYVLSEYVDAEFAIGVHVDNRVPDDPEARPARLRQIDLFAQPGETRSFD